MFALLNRLRGTWAYFAKVNSLVIGLIFGLATMDIGVGLWTAAGYLLGESMGWGKWIGGMISENVIPTEAQLLDKEGTYNGIHKLANWISPEKEHYRLYCSIALAIRGAYWGALIMLPLLLTEYITFGQAISSILIWAISFPYSVEIGKYSSKVFSYNFKKLSIDGTWEHAEVWYGLLQDIVILLTVLTIIKG